MFQLVMATDNEIVVWHTDLGHIFRFGLDEARKSLVAYGRRDVPDASEPAASVEPAAYSFATSEARARRLIP